MALLACRRGQSRARAASHALRDRQKGGLQCATSSQWSVFNFSICLAQLPASVVANGKTLRADKPLINPDGMFLLVGLQAILRGKSRVSPLTRRSFPAAVVASIYECRVSQSSVERARFQQVVACWRRAPLPTANGRGEFSRSNFAVNGQRGWRRSPCPMYGADTTYPARRRDIFQFFKWILSQKCNRVPV